MSTNLCSVRTLRRASIILPLGIAAVAVQAEVAGDVTYVECTNSGGNFRISELNRTVSYFSDRFQEYRPICRDCEITEWGNTIVMKSGTRTIVQIDRLSGRIWVRGMEAKPVAGSYTVRSFQGSCTRGKAATPRKKLETARAF